MGYDCSLHLIDEQFAKSLFYPATLGQDPDVRGPFIEWFEQSEMPLLTTAQGYLDGVRETLEQREASEHEPELFLSKTIHWDLALFSAYQHPVNSCRGFALSFFERAGLGDYFLVPESPDVLIPGSIWASKTPWANSPAVFVENWMVGGYVPAKRVSEMLAQFRAHSQDIARALDSHDFSERACMAQLLDCLKRADSEGCGVLEVTDMTGMAGSQIPMEMVKLGENQIEPSTLAEVDAAIEVVFPGRGARQAEIRDELRAKYGDLFEAYGVDFPI